MTEFTVNGYSQLSINTTIINNSIDLCYRGIRIEDDCLNSTIIGNNITQAREEGIYI